MLVVKFETCFFKIYFSYSTCPQDRDDQSVIADNGHVINITNQLCQGLDSNCHCDKCVDSSGFQWG